MAWTIETLVVCAVVLAVALVAYYSSWSEYPDFSKVRSVSAGGFHTCAVIEQLDGELAVKCFGDNLSGQLGLGLHPGSRDKPTEFILVGDDQAETPSLLPTVELGDIAKGATELKLSAGQYHTCVLVTPASAGGRTETKCWGSNGLRWGQLGMGNQTLTSLGKERGDMGNNLHPLKLPVATHGEQLSASYGHSCIRLNTSRITCWGWNEYAQLGVGDKSNRHSPAIVNNHDIAEVLEVQTGYTHTCALLKGGSTRCWGSNAHGQLGAGDNRQTEAGEYTEADLSESASGLSLGAIFGCAVLKSGNVECWGNLSWVGSDEVASAVVEFSSPAVEVTAGMGHVCALLKDRSVFCLGRNDFGQLGCDLQNKIVETPCKAADRIIQVDAGHEHTCAVRSDHTLRCWGGNSRGQLGLGDKTPRRRPSIVVL